MPAKHYIDIPNKRLTTVWEGDAVDIDMIESLKKYQDTIQSNIEYRGFNEILDLSKVTHMKLTTEGLKKIGSIGSSTDIPGVHSKLAIIVSSNIGFGLARMYETYRSFSKSSTKVIRVFKNADAALAWITI